MKPTQKEIVDLMIKQEKLLAKLYAEFALKFPEDKSFWMELSEEEELHASWISKLSEAEEKCLVSFDEGKIRAAAIKTCMSGVEQVLSKLGTEPFDSIKAVNYAMDIEKSLIEKNIIKHFEASSGKSRNVLSKLMDQTQKHLSKIEEKSKDMMRQHR